MNDTPANKSAPPPRHKNLWRVLRWGGTLAGFAYIVYAVGDFTELGAAFARVSPWTFLVAVVVMTLSLAVGCLRWRLLLVAYGAPKTPPFGRLYYLYLVGFFYNNFLPGAVGGDIVRGVVTKEAFGERGVTSALTVVLVERALGLAGLLCLSAGALAIFPLPEVPNLGVWAALGVSGAAAGVFFVAIGRRLSAWLPGRIGRFAADLPTIKRGLPFLWALVCSVVIHAAVAFVGYLFLHEQSASVELAQAFVIVPVAAATAFLPFTVGGAGAREAAFVFLCGTALGLGAPSAIAASLLLWGSQLVLGAIGGVAQNFVPLREAAGETVEES